MKVIVAEKPSVASEIKKVVGANNKCDGYYEGNGYAVTWCLGHLCGLKYPQDYDASLAEWTMETLPIIPKRFEYKVLPDKVEQFKIVANPLNSPDTDTIIEATDAEREGELIFRLVMMCSGCKQKNVYRLWINSLEDDAIRDGLRTMKPVSAYDNLYYSAACRQRADWLVGMNMSRYYSVAYDSTISCGRVQTPVLNFIVTRDLEIANFVPKDYFIITADMQTFKLTMNVETQAEANEVLNKCRGQNCVITKVEKKNHKKKAPHLYDLTTLQREANRLFGYSAEKALNITQALYEKKLLTYPRTDSRYITFNDKGNAIAVLKNLMTIGVYSKDAFRGITPASYNFDAIINDAEVSDHTAIIPTKRVSPDTISGLTDEEKSILRLVAYRLLEAVIEPYEYISVKVLGDIGGYEFGATGKEDVKNGWKNVERVFRTIIGKPEKEPVSLPALNENEAYQVFDLTSNPAKTQPPKHYTEDALLSAMETCGKKIPDDELKLAMKERGLGTPATRASIIEGLIHRNFVERKKSTLISTSKGRLFIAKVYPILKDPAMTGAWEKAIAEIRNGNMSPNDFMNRTTTFVNQFFNKVKTMPVDDPDAFKRDRIVGKCPICRAEVHELKKVYKCQNENCKWTLFKDICGKKITTAQAKKLLSKGKTDLIKGLKGKSGNEFSAYIRLNSEYKTSFEFPKNNTGGKGGTGKGKGKNSSDSYNGGGFKSYNDGDDDYGGYSEEGGDFY